MLYKMQSLPKCTTQIPKPEFIENSHFTDKTKFIDEIREIIGSDCWACVIDGEIIWNNYNKILNHKQRIYESMTRDYLIQNTFSIIPNDMEPHTFEIYMHSTRVLLIKISLKSNNYSMTFFN